MIKNDLNQFAKIMAVLGELYSKSITETLLSLYWRLLKPYPIEKIKEAVYSYLNHEDHGSFMPKPSDIIRHINEQEKTTALDAWSKVESAIRHIGRYSCIKFDDPIIHAVIIRMGGWSRLCSSDTTQITRVSYEFIKHYRDLAHAVPDNIPESVGHMGYNTQLIEVKKIDLAISLSLEKNRIHTKQSRVD
jgi:hypothetical protein